MGDWGCPLDMAFNTGPTQQISIKKSKKKKSKGIIKPEELKVSDYSENVHKAESDLSQMKQKLQQIKAFDDEYNIYEPIRRQQYIREEPQNEEQKKQISNEEYQAFKEYQLQRYQKNRNVVEQFSNVNDDFNDIILFALTGIFFIIFTDYIYELGKKSY